MYPAKVLVSFYPGKVAGAFIVRKTRSGRPVAESRKVPNKSRDCFFNSPIRKNSPGLVGLTIPVASLSSIAIQVVGESDVTGIEDIHVATEKATSAREGIFDLQGRRLNSEPSEGAYIKNGIKYVK